LANEKSEIVFGKVDITEEKELTKRFGVSLYPTLKFFQNGKPEHYDGSRYEKYLVEWLKKKTGEADPRLKAAKDSKHIKEIHIDID
jgi:thioredoxin-like negative regulator of GroEL